MRYYFLLCFLCIPYIIFSSHSDCLSLCLEYLYLKPSIYDPYFVIGEGEANEPSGIRYGNLFPYSSGIRLRGNYNSSLSNSNIFLEGLVIEDKAKRSLNFPNEHLGYATKGSPEFSSRLDDISKAISTISYRILSYKGGIKYKLFIEKLPMIISCRLSMQIANFLMREKIEYEIADKVDSVFADYKMHSWFIGPEIGFDINYQVLSRFYFVFSKSYALLAGIAGSSQITKFENNSIYAYNNKMSIISPFSEMKCGFNYISTSRYPILNFEIGYNFVYYDNAFDRINWLDGSAEGLSTDQYSPFMTHGLYVSIIANF